MFTGILAPMAVRLYRSGFWPDQWIVFVEGSGWFRFPARENGWFLRQAAGARDRDSLQPVPLRLSFKTGLWEEFQMARRGRAA